MEVRGACGGPLGLKMEVGWMPPWAAAHGYWLAPLRGWFWEGGYARVCAARVGDGGLGSGAVAAALGEVRDWAHRAAFLRNLIGVTICRGCRGWVREAGRG
jgi:hypothetical protein